MLKIQWPCLSTISLTASLLLGVTQARADIITALQDYTVNGNGTYTYTYQMSLSANSQLDPVTNGAPVQFGTIYDFGAEIGNPIATGLIQSSFTLSFANSNPPASQTMPFDNALLQNIRFTYSANTGVATSPGSSTNPEFAVIPTGDANLGTLTLTSTYSVTATPTAQYDGQTYNAVNGTQQANVGMLRGPDVQSSVSEPASISLLGAGLLGLGLARRRLGSTLAG